MRAILFGSYDNETERAREILDNSGIPYRLEKSRENYEGQVVLLTPAGRIPGLTAIRWVFGKREDLEAKAD